MKQKLFKRFHYDKEDQQIQQNQDKLAMRLSLTRIMESGLLHNLINNLIFDHERCCRSGKKVVTFISTYRKLEPTREWLTRQGWTECPPVYSSACWSFYKSFETWRDYKQYYNNLRKGELA